MRRRFLRDTAGAAGVEFALVCLIFIVMVLGAIDWGRFAWEINSAKAAARAGARFAAVSPMPSTYLRDFDAATQMSDVVLGNGDTVPTDSARLPPITCTSTGCTGNGGEGQDGYDAAAFTAIVNQMRGYYGAIQPQNVTITYRHVGIGVAGNPFAPDVEPLITVSLTGMTFQPIILQVLGLSFNIPSVETTYSGEDLA